MEEIVFYNSQGHANDKSGAQALAFATSVHSQSKNLGLRQAASHIHGSAITGTKPGDKIFVACKGKALIHVYSWGKESPDQKIPIPEQLSSIVLVPNNHVESSSSSSSLVDGPRDNVELPKFRLPFLLIGGGISGKLYVWELSSGLLLNVKEAHYQTPTVLRVSADGTYLISGGKDSRVLVWRIIDLVSRSEVIKPLHIISDNTLEISDIFINNSIHQDSKFYTASKDGTVRVYQLYKFRLITTFVVDTPVNSIVADIADRSIFVGLQNGNIRQIDLYEPNPATNILEAKGGYGKIVTVPIDHELSKTFTSNSPNAVLALDLSLDGSLLVSGDEAGRVLISDVTSKQTVKELKELGSSVANIKILNTYDTEHDTVIEKNIRSIPQLKRVIASRDPKELDILYQIGNDKEDELLDIEKHLDRVAGEALFFENFSTVNSQVYNIGSDSQKSSTKAAELESKLEKTTKAYKELRQLYEDLYAEHSKLAEK